MEKPTFPLPPGQYLVTGDRQVTTVLTIHPKDKEGNQRWELADGGEQLVLARERSGQGFFGESRGGHARRERLPQAGLRGSHRRWAARHSLSGRTQGAMSNAIVFTGTSGRIVADTD